MMYVTKQTNMTIKLLEKALKLFGSGNLRQIKKAIRIDKLAYIIAPKGYKEAILDVINKGTEIVLEMKRRGIKGLI